MHPNITEYWSEEFKAFFSPETGVDIDGLWIDMNEPTNVSNKNTPPKMLPKTSAHKILGL